MTASIRQATMAMSRLKPSGRIGDRSRRLYPPVHYHGYSSESNQVQLADIYGGREHVKDLSGWEGDTTFMQNDMKPSIGEDDYKADLDSVNLIGRMQKGQSYDQAITSYYSDLQKGFDTERKRIFEK